MVVIKYLKTPHKDLTLLSDFEIEDFLLSTFKNVKTRTVIFISQMSIIYVLRGLVAQGLINPFFLTLVFNDVEYYLLESGRFTGAYPECSDLFDKALDHILNYKSKDNYNINSL